MSRTVVFLHIPKTGGQTLDHIMERHYPVAGIFTVGSQSSIEQLQCLSNAEKQNIQYLKGHMPFGIHKWLPQPVTYFTVFRNPIERAISEYYYVYQSVSHPFHRELMERNMSLDDYVKIQVEAGETNLQTRWVSGFVDMNNMLPPYGHLQPDALAAAKSNLKSYFSVVGTTERFDVTLLLIGKVLGWSDLFYTKRNVGANRPARNKIDAQTIKFIEKHNQFDMELWEFVSRQLDEISRLNGISPAKLFLFRTVNERYGVSKLYKRIARLLKITRLL